MLFHFPLADAERLYPQYRFIKALTPSAQKAAFHVQDGEGRHLCLKIFAPDTESRRIEREIGTLLAIRHESVARFFEYRFSIVQDGSVQHYIVEEFVDGTDLADRLGIPWPRKEVVDFFAKLLDGLSALKAANVVHRDLKPHNIRVRPDGSPVIIDFGLARHVDDEKITSTAIGAGLGTRLYFAPEQWGMNRSAVDHRTDLFAVGLMMYEALLGVHPYGRDQRRSLDDLMNTCFAGAYLETEAFQALPRSWQVFLRKVLAKERGERPIDARRARDVLVRLEV